MVLSSIPILCDSLDEPTVARYRVQAMEEVMSRTLLAHIACCHLISSRQGRRSLSNERPKTQFYRLLNRFVSGTTTTSKAHSKTPTSIQTMLTMMHNTHTKRVTSLPLF